MSAENVQVLRDGYAAFAREDIAAVMAVLDDDIEWQTSDALPFGGTHHGHQGVGEFFGSLLEQWQELNVEPQEFIDGGDTVVVLVHDAATGAGGRFDDLAVHLWRMRNGKATSFREFLDTARVLQALGQPVAEHA